MLPTFWLLFHGQYDLNLVFGEKMFWEQKNSLLGCVKKSSWRFFEPVSSCVYSHVLKPFLFLVSHTDTRWQFCGYRNIAKASLIWIWFCQKGNSSQLSKFGQNSKYILDCWMEVDYSYENETRVNLGFQFYFLLNKIGTNNVNILLLQDLLNA